MNRTDDISNLFSRFGASAGSYHEFESQVDYKEKPPTPELDKASVGSAVQATEPPKSGASTAIEPRCEALENATPASAPDIELSQEPAAASQAPVVPDSGQAPHTAPVASSLLRNLLADVVHAREAQAQVLAEQAVRQEAAHGRPAKCKAHVVVMVSLKGGVGKTTLAAALASCLRLEDGRTLAIDLDPQNALHYHLGVEHGMPGVGSLNGAGHTWSGSLQHGFDGALLLPYGVLSDDEQHALINDMHHDRHWLARQLDNLDLGASDVVVIDTPTGLTPALAQALDVADQVIVITTADGASFNTLASIDRLLEEASMHRDYVVNQFDASREFSRDMLQVLKRRLGDQLLAVVSLDNTLGEALAYGRNPMSQVSPSPASEDVLLLAEQLRARLQASRAQGAQVL